MSELSDKPKYCHKCKAWHSQTDAGWNAGCVSEWAVPALLGSKHKTDRRKSERLGPVIRQSELRSFFDRTMREEDMDTEIEPNEP